MIPTHLPGNNGIYFLKGERKGKRLLFLFKSLVAIVLVAIVLESGLQVKTIGERTDLFPPSFNTELIFPFSFREGFLYHFTKPMFDFADPQQNWSRLVVEKGKW